METEYRQQINSRSSGRRDIENAPLPSQVSSQTQWNRTVAGEAETREDGLMWRFQSQKWLQFKGRRPVFCSWITPNFLLCDLYTQCFLCPGEYSPSPDISQELSEACNPVPNAKIPASI